MSSAAVLFVTLSHPPYFSSKWNCLRVGTLVGCVYTNCLAPALIALATNAHMARTFTLALVYGLLPVSVVARPRVVCWKVLPTYLRHWSWMPCAEVL